MPVQERPRVYEIRVHRCASTEEALALQEPIARVLCQDERHEPPCDVPWSFTIGDDDSDGTVVLVVGVYTSRGKAAELVERVRAVAGETRPVVLRKGDAERFDELVEQYRIEHGAP